MIRCGLFCFFLCIFGTVKPGVRYRDIGSVIQKHAQSHGFSVVRSYCGHGIHSLFHTAPNIPHYASTRSSFVFFLLLLLLLLFWIRHCYLFDLMERVID